MSTSTDWTATSPPPSECGLPQWYYIDIGNICNLKCPYCPTGNGKVPATKKGMMSMETFETILERIEDHAEFVCLFNWGEPFLNKNLLPMLGAFRDRGIKTHLDSNLTLRDFSDEESDAIVRSGLFSLFASIDGVTQENYEKYRVGGKVDQALENLRQLVRARDRLGSELPGLMWSFYLNKYNEGEVDRAREIAAEIGVDIAFKRLACPDEFQTSFVKNDPDIFRPPATMREMHPHQINRDLPEVELHPALPPVCRQPFTVAVINWDGTVTPCCAVVGKEFGLGNLLGQTMEDIWGGEPMVASRSFLSQYGPKQGGGSVCEDVCTAVKSYL